MAIEMVTRRVQTRMERKRTGPEEWLVVPRRPLADERMVEALASRDATEQDARHRYHYYLTPTRVSDTALKEPSLAALARVIKVGACCAVIGGLLHTRRGLHMPPSPASITAQ